MKKLSLLFASIFLLWSTAFATPLNEVDTVDAWTAIAQNTITVGETKTVSANYQTLLVIDAILDTATATTNGLRIRVQGSTSANDNNWYDIAEFSTLAGLTANTGNLTGGTDATNTTLTIASATLVKGAKVFIKDATIGNSELRLMKNIASTSTVTIESGLTLGHALNTPCWTGTGSGGQLTIATIPVNIPDSTTRIRTIYDNSYDATGSSVVIRSNIQKKTGL